MTETLHYIINRDIYDSLLYTVLGGLLVLCVYHFMMYIQNRDKAYLLYSTYTFFAMLAYFPVAESGFLREISANFGFDKYSKEFFTIIFNSIYFLFLAYFLRISRWSRRWFKIVTVPVLILMPIAVLCLAATRLLSNYRIFDLYGDIFILLISLHFFVTLYILLYFPGKLKYFILFGGIMLFVTSLIGETYVRELPWINISAKDGDAVYYIGVLLENVAFSLALGYRHKIAEREKNQVVKDYISQLEKNEVLRDKIMEENNRHLQTENEKIRYRQEIADLKLSMLQSQISPHFIFNALNSIKYYILENEVQIAAEYLTKFSKMIRNVLIASTRKDFTLEEELHTLQLYMELENLRFNNEVKFSLEVDPMLEPQFIRLPPLVLQPLVENALLHGVATVDNKSISIRVQSAGEAISISITDNGIGRNRKPIPNTVHIPRQSVGLTIVHGLLKNYFGANSYSLIYTDLFNGENPAGTLVTVTFPRHSA